MSGEVLNFRINLDSEIVRILREIRSVNVKLVYRPVIDDTLSQEECPQVPPAIRSY